MILRVRNHLVEMANLQAQILPVIYFWNVFLYRSLWFQVDFLIQPLLSSWFIRNIFICPNMIVVYNMEMLLYL